MVYNKSFEEKDGNKFKKYYNIEGDIDEFINSINTSCEDFITFYINDDADIGMSISSGEYLFPTFMKLYPTIQSSDIARLIYYYSDKQEYIDLMIPQRFAILSTKQPEKELEDIVKSGEKNHHKS